METNLFLFREPELQCVLREVDFNALAIHFELIVQHVRARELADGMQQWRINMHRQSFQRLPVGNCACVHYVWELDDVREFVGRHR